jgi:hypothetical protein
MDLHAEDSHFHGHEPIETDVRVVWRTGVALAGVVLATSVLIFGLMKWFRVSEGQAVASDAAKNVVALDDSGPLPALRMREQQLLTRYEWIDSESGFARIPVERAIEIISQNGLPSSLGASGATNPHATQAPESSGNSPPTAEAAEP